MGFLFSSYCIPGLPSILQTKSFNVKSCVELNLVYTIHTQPENIMNYYYGYGYSYNYTSAHSFPGMVLNRGTNKHTTARKLRAKARKNA